MHTKRDDFNLFLQKLISIGILHLLITICNGNQVSESVSFYNFIKAVDPENVLSIGWNQLVPHHCSHKWKGVKCDLKGTSIVEIRLDNLNFVGTFDADSLCNLPSLAVVSLAKNLIRGSISESIGNCKSLHLLDLSSNLLSGRVPFSLTKLKNLESLDISDNHFTGRIPHFRKVLLIDSVRESEKVMGLVHTSSESPQSSEDLGGDEHWYITWGTCMPVIMCIGLFVVLVYFMNKKAAKVAKERKILTYLQKSPPKMDPAKIVEDVKAEENCAELVFFVDEHESFKLEDLLEAAADLRKQSACSSLYKVMLKNNATYAVKRLKKLQVSFEEFRQTMRLIGNLKHPNILPLVGYNSSNEEKLLIYKYQSNGSLLNLLEGYIEGKRDFPWKLRLSIARGIARGLCFIEESAEGESIPHGNLKLSNILLDANEEPQISEYGISRFRDMNVARACLYSSQGYSAPERILSEQGDVYSFGVILLELLTGKSVEKSGIDLPKWVRAMVREEWTGEVFDKEVSKSAKQYAFPLLNVALKCVSQSPDNRPTMAEVLETLEEVVNSPEDNHISEISSAESSPHDCCVLHGVIPDTWDTPGSNY